MNKVLYIGQYTEGTTSRFRGSTLKDLISPKQFQVIDTNVPFFQVNRIFRSLGFRYKKGPLITKINQYVREHLGKTYDLIWVDKGVFIHPATTKVLKTKTQRLVHYTPDTAFLGNRSKLFEKGINHYDFLIMTKSFELSMYKKLVSQPKIYFLTQGFNPKIHYPRHKPKEKENSVIFIGLNEPSREFVISQLLNSNVKVNLAGKGWNKFVHNNDTPNLNFLGDKLFGDEYAYAISKSVIGLGLLSKRFPELHTTRTFEIPACGTCLLTEENKEINNYFEDDECIKFNSPQEMLDKVIYYLSNNDQVQEITEKGFNRVIKDQRDYPNQLKTFLNKIL
ncbi:glycosyltransferase [Balneola sp. MJW-20]|uniref:CgeB family protein n=1 Tax=Gracilimonas aurantiaca TaxID=3234185 RepID=UPI0034652CED